MSSQQTRAPSPIEAAPHLAARELERALLRRALAEAQLEQHASTTHNPLRSLAIEAALTLAMALAGIAAVVHFCPSITRGV